MKNALAMALIATALSVPSAMTARAADVEIIETAPQYETDTVGGVKIGYLTCDIGEGGGYVLGSAKELDCTFRSSIKGEGRDSYVGTIKKLGIEGAVSIELEYSPEPEKIVEWVREAYEQTDRLMRQAGLRG